MDIFKALVSVSAVKFGCLKLTSLILHANVLLSSSWLTYFLDLPCQHQFQFLVEDFDKRDALFSVLNKHTDRNTCCRCAAALFHFSALCLWNCHVNVGNFPFSAPKPGSKRVCCYFIPLFSCVDYYAPMCFRGTLCLRLWWSWLGTAPSRP